MYNTFELLRFAVETGLIKNGAAAPLNYFEYAASDPAPKLIAKFKNRDEALKALKAYKSTCRRVEGTAGAYYLVEVYAVECYEERDGDFYDGSDFYPAEQKTSCDVRSVESGDVIESVDTLKEALEIVERFEKEDAEHNEEHMPVNNLGWGLYEVYNRDTEEVMDRYDIERI